MIAESLPLSSDSSDSFEVLDLGPSVDQRVRRRGTIYSSNVHVLGSDDSPHGSPAAAHARPQVWAPADGMSNAALQLASSDAMLQGDTLWILVKAISSHAQHLLTSRSIQIIDPLGIEIPTSGETRSRLHRLQQFRTTLTYVHHATDHWSLAQVTVHRNENDGLRIRVSHYDSASQVAATDRVRKAFSSIVSQEAPGSSFEFEAMECPQQEDCYSCGIFATVFLTHLIHGTEMPHSIDPQQERRQFQKLLGDFERQTADASNASIDLTRKSLDKVTGGSHARPDEKSRSSTKRRCSEISGDTDEECIRSLMVDDEVCSKISKLIESTEASLVHLTAELKRAQSRSRDAATRKEDARLELVRSRLFEEFQKAADNVSKDTLLQANDGDLRSLSNNAVGNTRNSLIALGWEGTPADTANRRFEGCDKEKEAAESCRDRIKAILDHQKDRLGQLQAIQKQQEALRKVLEELQEGYLSTPDQILSLISETEENNAPDQAGGRGE
ncbi:hypothetical protein CGRA01v4_15043 [Colletotrichum graminicola]|nr:hypothetical protein CGRA01v4_15043 [Colletotrichum graminicola]